MKASRTSANDIAALLHTQKTTVLLEQGPAREDVS
jgi:hypothetical protein